VAAAAADDFKKWRRVEEQLAEELESEILRVLTGAGS
jgi:hypothetical protein